ncbi:hypothetical protein PHMEG_0009755 [Phytophthora megakarya]|uniref:FAR1 domain-containing protein n=1 Tax=Phytophthora megakarya TaxID=4795 RepID=A0A225WHH6_9STRA|nr:hypothetical protein PHMEG_0009755 [Phytophthora megakarya]
MYTISKPFNLNLADETGRTLQPILQQENDGATRSCDSSPPKKKRKTTGKYTAGCNGDGQDGNGVKFASEGDGESDATIQHYGANGRATSMEYIGMAIETTTFDSWEAFDSFLRSYQARSFQVDISAIQHYSNNTNDLFSRQKFRVRSNKTVSTRNAVIAQNKANKAFVIPDKWGFYAKTFACTHCGKYISREQGARPNQRSRAIGCKAQINLCVSLRSGHDTFRIYITKVNLAHNHPLVRETFEHYPTTRLSIPNDVVTTVDMLHRSGVNSKKILKYIR